MSGFIRPEQPAAMGIHYRYYSLNYMLDSQRRAGYQSIELYCAMPHVKITAEGIADKSSLLRKIRASGLKVICVTPDNCMGPWQYAVSGNEMIEQSKRYFLHVLELAYDLNCHIVSCNSGWGMKDEPREEGWKRSIDFMDWYCTQAKKYGITLVMESLRAAESNLVNNLPSLVKYLKEIGQDNIRPMIDTCAMAVAGESMEEWFRAFGNTITHMHFIDGTPFYHLAWGDGNRKLDSYMESIEKHDYQGFLTQEITDGRYYKDPAAADIQSYQALQKYF